MCDANWLIVHHNAGPLRDVVVSAPSARDALVAWHGSERGVFVREDGTPFIRYAMVGDPAVVLHEYIATPLEG